MNESSDFHPNDLVSSLVPEKKVGVPKRVRKVVAQDYSAKEQTRTNRLVDQKIEGGRKPFATPAPRSRLGYRLLLVFGKQPVLNQM